MNLREMRPTVEAQPEIPAKVSAESLAAGTDIAISPGLVSRFKSAHAVPVIGKVARRHVLFGLAAALKAVERADAKGDYAAQMLVRLASVGGAR